MWIQQQMFVACLCILLELQQIIAVVNNGQTAGTDPSIANTTTTISSSTTGNKPSSNNLSSVADSIAESSEQKTNRREAPIELTASYGTPQLGNTYGTPLQDTYLPSLPSGLGLPVPVYGAPSSNIVYPAPPPDIPPPIQSLPTVYGPAKDVAVAATLSVPPLKYGSPASRPLKPFNFPSFDVPKFSYGRVPLGTPPRSQYGPPVKPIYNPPKLPRPFYGSPLKLPKPHYGPPKLIYVHSKPLSTYGPPTGYLNPAKGGSIPLKSTYGPSKLSYGPPSGAQYGPPEPVPHGPSHPGAPAPPTPPDIKYDGWQPIPGLVSRPPSETYGVPKGRPHGINDLQINTDFVPPATSVRPAELGQSYKGSDSYGAPLNTVTGSGGIISSSGEAHGHQGFGGGTGGNSGGFSSSLLGSEGHSGPGKGLSVVKSVGYELLPTSENFAGIQGFGDVSFLADTYATPPLNSYYPNGAYAAAHSYNSNDVLSLPSLEDFASSLASSFDTTLLTDFSGLNHDFTSSIGLIPPSGIYGVPPSGTYGTPLLQPPNKYGTPPKHPVIFREPVPSGLIESIGNSVAHKDAHGIIDNVHSNNYVGPSYVPPPVPDITKPVKEEVPTGPSTFYSLPTKNPSPFQNYIKDSVSTGLGSDFSGSLNTNSATAAALTSYTAPLGTIDGSYGLPQPSSIGLTGLQTASSDVASSTLTASNSFGVPHSFGASLSNDYGTPYFGNLNGARDCYQKSQSLPSLSAEIPAADSNTVSLSSLHTNTAGTFQGQPFSSNYGAPDLQSAYSQSSSSISGTSSNKLEEQVEQQVKVSSKALAANFASGNDLVKSQSIDLNNIPLQGALGTYTLQIQSADGGEGTASVPHNQVLNDGLLQSILNAIEQPQQNTPAILGQPLLHLQQLPPQSTDQTVVQAFPSSSGQLHGLFPDSEAQHSVTKNIVITPPPLQSITTVAAEKSDASVTQQPENGKDGKLSSEHENEIALYFSNNVEAHKTARNTGDNFVEDQDLAASDVRNGQQYGNYISLRSANSSFVCGDVKSTNPALQEATVSLETKVS